MKLHELQEQRSAAVVAMRTLADQVEGASRDYTKRASGHRKHLRLSGGSPVWCLSEWRAWRGA